MNFNKLKKLSGDASFRNFYRSKNSINLIFEYKKNYTERYLSIISENKKFLNEFK